MIELFNQGGILFMSVLSLEFLAALGCALFYLSRKEGPKGASVVRSVGLLAFVTGILGQSIGLYEAMKSIEIMGGVSPAMLAGGLKISFISTIYGTLIFAISLLISLFLKFKGRA